ncbi:MAG: hypothetical protein ACRD45_10760 [Bryobacteraceae bacterium]
MVLRTASLSILACCLLQAQSTIGFAKRGAKTKAPAPSPLAEIPPPPLCAAGGPLGAVQLRVRAPRGALTLPFRTINHLSEGDTVLYKPILRPHEKRRGEVSLVLIPSRRTRRNGEVIITDPKPARRPQQWKIPRTITLAALVYGPSGLSKKKVKHFLAKDDLLIAQLADYAARTEQTEALLQTLERANSSSASVNAALSGFASQYGLAVTLDKNAPSAVQAETLFSTMNPQLATYNPLARSSGSRVGQTASLATAAAGLFFGNPVGLAAGGTAMLLDLRAIAFPDTQFRSSFAQVLPRRHALNLCGQSGAVPPHTRIAYIWATRIPNTPTPNVQIGADSFIPAGRNSPVPVSVPSREWKYLERARHWSLDNGNTKTRVRVLKLGNQGALEIDLASAQLPPGDYHLSGYWDWASFTATGEIHVRLIGALAKARLQPASQDRLLAHSGKIAATLTGADFEFTTKAQLQEADNEFAVPRKLRFLLPKGLRAGPQRHMDVQIDTAHLNPGKYDLLLSQGAGPPQAIPIKILAPAPSIDNLPILANQGASAQHYVLQGKHLDRLSRMKAPDAVLRLGDASSDHTQRNVTVQLKPGIKPDHTFPVKLYFRDRVEPVVLPHALRIIGPLPRIASARLSPPQGLDVALNPGEAPAGTFLTAVLDVKNIRPRSLLRLACASGIGPRPKLHIGEQTSKYSLQRLSQDQLFLSLDTSDFPAGCSLQALIDNDGRGRSRPFTLAHLIRLPRIETFQADRGADAHGLRSYTLTGYDLEMIGEAGWAADKGMQVADLPAPIPGEGQKQILHIGLPTPPGAKAPLFIWLRGEATGRATTIVGPASAPSERAAASRPSVPKNAFRPPVLLPPVLQAPMPPAPSVTPSAAAAANPAAAITDSLPLPVQMP